MCKRKALITGASGFLASHLIDVAGEHFDLFGMTHRSNLQSGLPVKSAKCDLRSYKDVKKFIDHTNPKVIFHLAALSDPNLCQIEAKLSEQINYRATIELASLCFDRNIDFIFTSTDLVFDGLKGSYDELDDVNPISRYGEHKIMAEESLMDNPIAKICRMPLMYGQAPLGGKSMFDEIKAKLNNYESINLFVDEFRSAVNGYCAAQGLILACKLNYKLLHLGGPLKQSRYEMGIEIARFFNLSDSLINKCFQQDVKMPAERPQDVSLNSSLAYSLGYVPKSLSEFLKKFGKYL